MTVVLHTIQPRRLKSAPTQGYMILISQFLHHHWQIKQGYALHLKNEAKRGRHFGGMASQQWIGFQTFGPNG
jgi:hypothetical protein